MLLTQIFLFRDFSSNCNNLHPLEAISRYTTSAAKNFRSGPLMSLIVQIVESLQSHVLLVTIQRAIVSPTTSRRVSRVLCNVCVQMFSLLSFPLICGQPNAA